MLDPGEIDKALEAHAAWKVRLHEAIESGKSESTVTIIADDNKCAFGKWLYGKSITEEEKATEEYKQIVILHAQFHKVAAKIASLALAGMKTEAMRMMDHGKEYTLASGQLSLALKRWKETMKPVTTR